MLHILLLLLTLSSSSLENDIILSNAKDFTNFVSDVNSGTNYSEYTIFLGSDIALTESIDPIGNYTYQFRGIFDGQGHIINNLKMNASLRYTGLFGYSKGLTIRNVVLDSSCSITNVFKNSGSSYVHTGGIIGRCESTNGGCNIENIVNMADVTFSGNISGYLYFGGIAGYLSSSSSSSYNSYVKNCVNYGSVTDLGTVDGYADLGGIVGLSTGNSPVNAFIQNCINHGTITHGGASANLVIGGVVCLGYLTYIENCVSAGKISTQTTASKGNSIGSIVGSVNQEVYINYCYFTSDVNASSINGTGTLSSTTGTPDTSTDVDSDLVSKLNSNATSCNWGKWFMLHLNGGSINNIAQDPLIGIQKALPNPMKEGHTPSWCKDAECTEEFDPETASGITDLYAGWTPNNYTVTFDFGNGTTVSATFSYNTEIIYPENSSIMKEGYTLSWDKYRELMPARDIAVTAQWTPNNYTVTFDANGGNISETSKIVTFNKKYGKLPVPNRAGYMFLGWCFTKETNGTEVTNETTITTPNNHALYAHWEEVTAQVEIVFSTKDLTQEDVNKLIEKYASAGFEIVKFENGSEGLRVIVKFDDKEEAENFFRNIKESRETTNMIKRIVFDQSSDGSFSIMAHPLSFFIPLFL